MEGARVVGEEVLGRFGFNWEGRSQGEGLGAKRLTLSTAELWERWSGLWRTFVRYRYRRWYLRLAILAHFLEGHAGV